METNQLVEKIYNELLIDLHLESVVPYNPVVVHRLPSPWEVLGTGNYAAVLCHPKYPEKVVKIYAPGRPGLEEEVEVYKRIGSHPAFSECFYAGENFLVLKRLNGITLYDCLYRGLKIPQQVIQDIDLAIEYALSRGLKPHDVHGRNVMMNNGQGFIVDVSDFLHQEPCLAWQHFKMAYYGFYIPIFSHLNLKVPYFCLDWIRHSYRLFRRMT